MSQEKIESIEIIKRKQLIYRERRADFLMIKDRWENLMADQSASALRYMQKIIGAIVVASRCLHSRTTTPQTHSRTAKIGSFEHPTPAGIAVRNVSAHPLRFLLPAAIISNFASAINHRVDSSIPMFDISLGNLNRQRR